MKTLLTLLLTSTLLASVCRVQAADDFVVVDPVPATVTQPAAPDTAPPAEAPPARSNDWTWKRLAYGPIELCAAGLMPLMGIFVGGTIGAIVPLKGMHPYCKVLVPYTAPRRRPPWAPRRAPSWRRSLWRKACLI